ncbi:MAG: hypothetical protein K0B08_12470 [Bacteroidales bacterium]|nr:hypothetical protein [Bacteroidales bacterium]
MCKRVVHIIICVIISGWFTNAHGQYTGATARLDTNSILIGDQIGLELTVTVPTGRYVQWPVFIDTLVRNVEILRKSGIDTVASASGYYTIRQKLFITSFDSGMYVIPPLYFRYFSKGDTLSFFMETMPLYLEVQTIAVEPDQDIKPIKPPLRAPVTIREMLPWIGLILLAILLAFALFYYLKRRKKTPPVVTTRLKPTIPPYEAAVEALNALRQKKLWQAGRVKDYYSELTDIVREYIELRFGVRALEMTTGEIETALRPLAINAAAREKLHQTLLLADLVKFAKAQPLPLENDTSMEHCIDFVRETKPPKENIPAGNEQVTFSETKTDT